MFATQTPVGPITRDGSSTLSNLCKYSHGKQRCYLDYLAAAAAISLVASGCGARLQSVDGIQRLRASTSLSFPGSVSLLRGVEYNGLTRYVYAKVESHTAR